MTLEQRAERLYGDLLTQIGKGGSPVQLRLIVEAFHAVVSECEKRSGSREAIESAVSKYREWLAGWHDQQARYCGNREMRWWHEKAAEAIRSTS